MSKTAMQELIEFIELNIDDNDFIKHQVLEEADKALEKEKEQIMNAFLEGKVNHSKDWAIEYYNQTYNQQKQHIIDIMKADEDDGLYDLNK